MSQDPYIIQKTPTGRAQSRLGINILLAGLVILIIVAVGSFTIGRQYQKSHGGSTASATSSQFGPGGTTGKGFGGQRLNGSFGSVTAISADSISVNNQRTGTVKSYSITGATQISNNGTSASYSDIAVGDSVLVATSSSTSTVATTIRLNPTMGGPGSSGAGGGNNMNTSDSSSQTN